MSIGSIMKVTDNVRKVVDFMNATQTVSVLMSAYNESLRDLNRSIYSILNQTYTNIEYIVVCDNPDNIEMKDFLKEVEKKESRVILILNEKNIGLTNSLNKALQASHGEYIARMDADDYSMPQRIEKQLQYLQQHDLDLVGCYVECVDEEEKTIYFLNSMPSSASKVQKKICVNNPIAHPTWFGKKDLFMNNHGYRAIPYAEDYDFLLRALENGARLGNVSEVYFKYTLRSTSISKSNGLRQYLVSRELVKYYKNNNLSSIDPDVILCCFKHIDQKEEQKYTKASNEFALALQKLKKKHISCIVHLWKASTCSRYFFVKMVGYMRAFL